MPSLIPFYYADRYIAEATVANIFADSSRGPPFLFILLILLFLRLSLIHSHTHNTKHHAHPIPLTSCYMPSVGEFPPGPGINQELVESSVRLSLPLYFKYLYLYLYLYLNFYLLGSCSYSFFSYLFISPSLHLSIFVSVLILAYPGNLQNSPEQSTFPPLRAFMRYLAGRFVRRTNWLYDISTANYYLNINKQRGQ